MIPPMTRKEVIFGKVRPRRNINPAFVFCLICGLLAIAVALDAQAPIGSISPLAGAFPGTLSIATGKTFTVNNTLTLAGTDGTTLTFPTTSATIARTDATNTFTGQQNFSGVIAGASDIFGGAVNAIYWNGRTTMYSPADGVWQVTNLAKNNFTLMNFGPNTSSFPALKRSTTVLQIRLGDDSGFGTLQGQFASTDGSTGFTGTACTAFKNGLCVTGTP